MIHSPGSMPTGNFGEHADSTTQPVDAVRPRRWPADYYSAPLSEVRPVLPKWVPWGCGGAAILALVVMVAAGALLTGSRLNALIDLALGMSLGEMKGMYTAGVTEQQKASLDAEITRMREALQSGRISVKEVQPFMQAMQRAVGDDEVTPAEAEELTRTARAAADAKPVAGSS